MANFTEIRTSIGLAALLWAFTGPVAADSVFSTPGRFSLVLMDRDDTPTPELEVRQTNDEMAWLSGSVDAAFYAASSQTDFGLNRVFNTVAGGALPTDPEDPGDPYTTALSLWTDSFTITGSEATGIVRFRFDVEGSLVGEEYSELNFHAVLSPSPITVDDEALYDFLYDEIAPETPSGTIDLFERETDSNDIPGPQHVQWRGEADYTYTSGTTFYILALLGGHAYGNATLDALGTARFSLWVPPGVTVNTGSGTRYPTIPEPTPLALLALGLLVVSRIRRRPIHSQRM